MREVRPLRSPGVTPFPRYYEPVRLPAAAAAALSIPLPRCLITDAPRRVSQDPHCLCQCAPSPITPSGPVDACARCFSTGSRLRHLRKSGHRQLCHEAESGSLALGSHLRSLAATPAARPALDRRTDPFRAVGCPSAPDRSYMVNEQFTWLTPRSQQETAELTWHTEGHEGHEAHKAKLLESSWASWAW
jgi:hypothetical protein